MRVCDRHPRKPASGKIIIEETDNHVDLCDECISLITEFIGNASQKEIKPKEKRRGFLRV